MVYRVHVVLLTGWQNKHMKIEVIVLCHMTLDVDRGKRVIGLLLEKEVFSGGESQVETLFKIL